MNTRQFISRGLIVSAVLIGCFVSPRFARAQVDDFALSVVLGNGPYFSTDRWLPVRIVATNRSKSEMTGQVVFPFAGQSEKVTFRLPMTVQARSTVSLIAYVFIPVLPDTSSNRKSNDVPPVCIAEWRDSGGKMVSRCPMLARPNDDDPESGGNRVRVDRTYMLTLGSNPELGKALPDVATDSGEFIRLFQSSQGTRLLNMAADANDAPRDLLGYDAINMIVLDGGTIDRVDPAQQQALVDYMTSGGAVVLADSLETADPASTWIGPYLPARRVGSRYANSLSIRKGDGVKKFKLVAPIDLSEWVADPTITGAQVVAADGQYVHAAYRQVGLGRLIVTSFPVSALDIKDPAVQQLWAELFPSTPPLRWDTSKLASTQSQLLESMVGLKVPPWIVAASVVCAYLALVLIIQLVARQGLRPMGFAAAVGLSILIAAGLVVFSFFRDNTVQLSMARIDLLDLDRGGVRNEAVTLLGPDSEFAVAVNSGVSLRQAPSAESKPLDLTIAPLQADHAAVYPRRIERVWQASSALDPTQILHAAARFDEQGLSLSIDNHIGALTSPVLVGGNGQFDLPALAEGASTVRVDGAGLNTAAVQLDAAQLRRRILAAAMSSTSLSRSSDTPHLDDSIYLAGWLTEAPASLLQLPPGQTPAVVQNNALARTRVAIEPSPVGSKVHIAKAFTQMMTGDTAAMPYDAAKREWLEQFMPQEFLIGFAFPAGIGKVKTTQVKIDVQANTPQHTLTLRRGQVTGGRPQMNPAGSSVAVWDKMIGSNSVSFEVAPGDVDANGWLWLMVSVDGPAGQSRWSFQDFAVTYDGVVEGPPQPVVMPRRDQPSPEPTPAAHPKPQSPKPQTPKKPADSTTKPAKKPANKPAQPPKKKESQPQ